MKKVIRLTESDLHRIVESSTRRILSELDWKTYQNASRKRHEQGKGDAAYDLSNASEKSFNDKYGYNDEWDANLQHGGSNEVFLTHTYDNEDGFKPNLFAHKSERHPSLYGAYKSTSSSLRHTPNGDTVIGGSHESCNDNSWSSDDANDFSFGHDDVFKSKYGGAKREYDNYTSGKSKYVPGKGWQ